MTLLELQHRLLFYVKLLKLPLDEVDLFLRPYSKTYYGRYFPVTDSSLSVKPKIYIYPFEENGTIMSFDKVFSTVVHEFCHHIQYVSGYKRIKGVMHDSQFWQLYNYYIEKYNVLGGEKCEAV